MMTVINVQLKGRKPRGEGLLRSIKRLKIKEYSGLAQLPESCKQLYGNDLKLKNNHVSNTSEHDSYSCVYVCVCVCVCACAWASRISNWEIGKQNLLFVQQLPILGKYWKQASCYS